MKKIITLFFTVLLVLSLTPSIFAEGVDNTSDMSLQKDAQDIERDDKTKEIADPSDKNEDIKEYIKEKIAPVVIGVITSVLALIGSIGSIKKTLFSLKDSKDILSLAQITFKNELEDIKKELIDIPELKNASDKLQEDFANITKQLKNISEILALAYSTDENLVRCGKSSKMQKLLEGTLMHDGVDEIEK